MLFTAAASTRLLISASSRFRSICLTVKAMEKPAGGRAKLIANRVQKKPVQKKPALQKKPVQEKPGSAEEAELVKQSLVSTLMESSQSEGTFPEPSQSQGATLNMMSPWMTDSQPDSLLDSQPDSLQAEIAEALNIP